MADKKENDTNKDGDLKTFDMYRFFSRKDVVLMILFILAMLIIILYQALFTGEVV